MLFLHWRLRSRFDLIKPNVAAVDEKAEEKQCHRCQVHAKDRTFAVGDKVLVCDYWRGEKWMPGIVLAKTEPVSYRVDVGLSVQWRCHVDQMLAHQNDGDCGEDIGPENTRFSEDNQTNLHDHPV